jgi:hypothetical protein
MWSTAALAPASESDEIRILDPIDDAYESWKAADAAARVLEREARETWLRFERGVGAGPSSGLLREVACLRHEARERLSHAVRLLHEAGYIQAAVAGTKMVKARAAP